MTKTINRLSANFADVSFDQIRTAIAEKFPSAWIREIFDGYAILQRDGKLWRANYSVDGLDVTVEELLTEVAVEYVPIAGDEEGAEMAGMTDQWMEVFREGDYGEKGSYSRADLQAVADGYDPKEHEAPIVIGHPTINAPAFGWIERVRLVDDPQGKAILEIKARDVQPEFEEMVQRGLFKKRSIAFYQNPLRLRHVGFLGAAAPEVKGLKDLNFDSTTFVEFLEDTEMDEKTLTEKIQTAVKNFFAQFADQGGPKPLNEEVIAGMISRAVKSEFSSFRTEIETKEKERLAREENARTEFAEKEKTANQQKAVEEAKARLVGKNRWLPAYEKMGALAIFSALAGSAATIEFEEGGKKESRTVLDSFVAFLESLPAIVPSGELKIPIHVGGSGKALQFTPKAGIGLDETSVQMNERAEELTVEVRKEQPNAADHVVFAEALRRARVEFAEKGAPGKVGASSVGAV